MGFFRDGNEMHPYVWWNGAAVPDTFDLQGAVFPADQDIHNSVMGINNAGYLAGVYAEKAPSGGMAHRGFVTDGHAANATKAFTRIDCAGLGGTAVTVRGINETRDIAGRYDDPAGMHGFVSLDAAGGYAKCVEIKLPFAGAQSVVVADISDTHQIVGLFRDATKKQHGFFGWLDPTGQPFGLTQVDYPLADSTRLDGVDNNGYMLGTYTADDTSRLFLCWYGCHSGAGRTLGPEAVVQRVSASVALGATGWVWPLGRIPHPEPPPLPFMRLGSTPGSKAMVALAINDLLEGIDDPAARGRIREPLFEYLLREVRGLASQKPERG